MKHSQSSGSQTGTAIPPRPQAAIPPRFLGGVRPPVKRIEATKLKKDESAGKQPAA